MAKSSNPDIETRDLDPDEMPTHTPEGFETVEAGRVLGEEEFQDTKSDLEKNPVDLTVDSEPGHARALAYDPIIHERTKVPNVEVDPASWDDLRSLPAPPPTTTAGVKVYVSIQHPSMVVFSPDGHTVLGQFENGYLATDDPKLQKLLESPRQRYVKRLDMRESPRQRYAKRLDMRE